MANAGTDPIANLGFEDAGAYAGSAKWWTLSSNAGWLSFAFASTEQPATIEVDPTIDTWTGTNAVVTADDVVAPNGEVTGAKLEDDGTNGLHQVAFSIDVVEDSEYVFGVWLRAGDLPYAGFRVGSGTDHVEVIFDLRLGMVTAYTESDTGFDSSSYRVVAGRGPWKFYMIAFKPTADATIDVSINTSVNGLQFGYSGSSEYVYAWQPRVVVGSLGSSESMGSWLPDYEFELGLANSAEAFFDNGTIDDEPFDGFETTWGTLNLVEFVWDAFVAMFDVGANAFDAMSWYTAVYTFAGTDALFDGNAWELFGWPTFYELGWGPPFFIDADALFDAGVGMQYAEDFEEFQADVYATTDATLDTLNATAHGLADGTIVYVLVDSGNAFPEGLMTTLQYEVMASAPNSFQLSTDGGITPINITTNSTCIVRGDPATQWTGAEAY